MQSSRQREREKGKDRLKEGKQARKKRGKKREKRRKQKLFSRQRERERRVKKESSAQRQRDLESRQTWAAALCLSAAPSPFFARFCAACFWRCVADRHAATRAKNQDALIMTEDCMPAS
eukprot:3394435-Rhodomonas_salina.1